MRTEDYLKSIFTRYQRGEFPHDSGMLNERITWINPRQRAAIPITNLNIRKSLKRALKKDYAITLNQNFNDIVKGCAQTYRRKRKKYQQKRHNTWLNNTIARWAIKLHKAGLAHSLEYHENGELLGGLYGISINGIFSAQSMFSKTPYASQIALVHLCARLEMAGYKMLDAQKQNEHLRQFGAYEIPHKKFIKTIYQTKNENPDIHLNDISENEILETYWETREKLKTQNPITPPTPK